MTSPEQPGNWSDPTAPTAPSSPPAAPASPPAAPLPPAAPASPPAAPPAVPVPPAASTSPTEPYPTYAAPPPPYPPQPGQPYGGYAYGPVAPPTNGLAIASMIVSILGFGPIGAIMGHIARNQIRERGEQGDGFALAGIIVGWVTTGIWVVCCGGYAIFIAGLAGSGALNS